MTMALIALLALLLFVLERVAPLRAQTREFVTRLVVNVAISATALLIALFVVQPAARAALHWANDRPFGLLHMMTLPAWLEFAVGVLLMDLAFYYWHLANHRAPLLWRFHNVHHIDPDLDVTTAFRFHFGEIALSAIFSALEVALIGVSPMTFAMYQLAFQAEVIFHHSNVRLPIALERLLNALIVTPRMHGIHHSQIHRENNSNFGTIFSFWDRLHRTLGLNVPQDEIVVGVPAYSQPNDNEIGNALLMPFRAQRDYWRAPDGTLLEVREAGEANRSGLAE